VNLRFQQLSITESTMTAEAWMGGWWHSPFGKHDALSLEDLVVQATRLENACALAVASCVRVLERSQ
jgi:hypothetical protein